MPTGGDGLRLGTAFPFRIVVARFEVRYRARRIRNADAAHGEYGCGAVAGTDAGSYIAPMRTLLATVAAAALLAGCASETEPGETEPGPPVTDPGGSGQSAGTQPASTTQPASGTQAASESTRASTSTPPTPPVRKPVCKVGPRRTPDGTRRFWTKDKRCFRSPWFARAHRVMIYFGCTRAPYYTHDPKCPGRQGVHHGIDVDMPVGTAVYSHVRGRIVKGTLGSAYGSRAFIVRTRKHDFVIGHVRRALVRDGARVRKGQRIARSGRRGAPDGAHLHLEVRPRGGSYTQAVPPKRFVDLRVKRR